MQQPGLAVGLFLRHLPALVRQHQPPRHDARHHQQRHVGLQKTRTQCGFGQGQRRVASQRLGERLQFLVVEQHEHAGHQWHDHQHQQDEVAQARVQVGPYAPGRQPAQRTGPLGRQAGVRLAQVTTTRVQRAAQRTDGALVSRAMRHVGALRTGVRRSRSVAGAGVGSCRPLCVPGDVIPAPRGPGHQRRCDERGAQRNQRRERLRQRAEQPQVRADRQRRTPAPSTPRPPG